MSYLVLHFTFPIYLDLRYPYPHLLRRIEGLPSLLLTGLLAEYFWVWTTPDMILPIGVVYDVSCVIKTRIIFPVGGCRQIYGCGVYRLKEFAVLNV